MNKYVNRLRSWAQNRGKATSTAPDAVGEHNDELLAVGLTASNAPADQLPKRRKS